MYNGYKNSFSNNKEVNSIQALPNDDLFISNTIQIPKQFNHILLEDGSNSNEDEPDPSVIHSSDENSINSSEKEKKEIDSIFDFENIELPREEEKGDFTILSDFKIESLDSKIKNQKVEKEKENKEKKDKEKDKKSELIKLEENSEESEEEDDEEMKLEAWDLLKVLVLTKSKNKKTFGRNFKHFISSLIYNYKSFNHKLNQTTVKFPLNIFDSKINNSLDINHSKLTFLYMSYRSGLLNMKYLGIGEFTSDSGWGCMLRCCQMMLSRGIIKNELYKLHNDKGIIKDTDIINLIKDTLCLFNDSFIPFKELKNNIFLSNIYEKYHGNENIYELIPPYSIFTLCKVNKSSGVYTSDMKIIKCFVEINNQQFFNNSYGIVHFENGIIQKKYY